MATEIQPVDKLQYLPAPEIAPGFQKAFEEIVPLSPNGIDRLLRFVWGMDRLEYVAGFQVPRYGDTVNDPPKYRGRPRWVLEGWQSPEAFDEVEWKTVEHLLGPFPRTGIWDFLEFHETADGEFLPLDETALERCRSWKFWRGKGPKRSLDELMEKKMLRWSLQEQRRQRAAGEVAQEFGEQVVRILENNPNPVSSHGSNIKAGGFKKSPGGILIRK